jgi:hypothetical protein
MIIILNEKITPEELEKAKEAYPDYIKTVVDIEKKILAVGGEYHIDCEEVLLQNGSLQENLYGGGWRISSKQIEYTALSNYKPALGRLTYEISDPKIRKLLEKLTRQFLEI